MRRHLAVLLVVAACGRETRSPEVLPDRSEKLVRARAAIPGQYVVVLDGSVAVSGLEARAAELASRHHATVLHVYGAALNGFAAAMSATDALALAAEPDVRWVEEDGRVRAAAAPGGATQAGAPPPPAGVGVSLYVLDTGVRLDHVELAGRATAAYPDPGIGPASADCNGHGTWVAALAAGATQGVAPGALVRSVKVLGCDGSGGVSSVLAGVEWVLRNHATPAVGLLAASGGPSPSLDEAIARSVAGGVTYVVAAGNSGADACDASPGRVDGAITVGAVGTAPAGAPSPYVGLDLSNGGRCVDVLAPGEDVVSAWNTHAGATHTMSGTSAAAARVAGAAASFLELRPDAMPAHVGAAIAGTSLVGAVSGLGPGTPNRILRPEGVRSARSDRTAPQVQLVSPAPGATLGGTVSLTAIATDDAGVTLVAFFVDGVEVGADASAPYAVPWDTTASGNGPHALVARAYDAGGNLGESDAVLVTVDNPGFALFDATLGAPRCAAPAPVCDSSQLLVGRGAVGPERNSPNAIGLPCGDGSAGFFHIDESVDAIRIATLDGGPLAVGKGVEVRVKVWSYVDFASDALDLYVAGDASAPAWRFVTTLEPAAAGESVLAARLTLGEGATQALRAAFRFGGTAATCTSGIYDDRDDLVFAVAPGIPDSAPPQVSIASPRPGEVLGGATTLAAIAIDDRGVVSRVEFLVDGALVATSWTSDATGRFEAPWNAATVPDGTHEIRARAVDGAGNVSTSLPISFRVADVQPPTVAISFPEPGAAVGGVVTLRAEASDDRAVHRVSFLVNGAVVGVATAPPWEAAWDTAALDGPVTLVARARDAAGHETTSAPVQVHVDHVAPTVEITAPLPDAVVSGIVTLTADVGDVPLGIENVAKVEFLANGVVVAVDDRTYPSGPCSAPWRTGSYPNGRYALVARAYDAAGNVGTSDPAMVEVKDDTPPQVSIATPEDGSAVRGIVEFTAVASDEGLLHRVELFLDGAKILSAGSPPYTVLIDTIARGLADGDHTLEAKGYDVAGNSATATARVQVDNTPPAISLTAPAASATVSGTYELKAMASDGHGIARVDFYVGSAVLAVDTEAPYAAEWDTTRYDNGDYEVGAVAYDAAGNATTSQVVVLSAWNASTADHDAARGAPACREVAPFCFSGTLLESRGPLRPRPERNAPNTLDGCADGILGEYGVDESVEGITIRSLDGAGLAPGKAVAVEVRFLAVSPEFDRVDVFHAANAHDPAWVPVATLVPTASGPQTLSATYVLPTGPVQAVRAASRYAESGPATCAPGSFDDRDDLVFAVATAGVDVTSPAVSILNPADGGTVHGAVRVAATASDDRGVARVDFEVDGTLVATGAVPPYEVDWDTTGVADGIRRITATAHDTSGNARRSNPVFVTVAGAANARYDATRLAATCAARGSFCDTGTLLEGRDLLGPEVHAPSTLRASCPDGNLGRYLQEESIERIVLRTDDGLELAPGKEARVDVTVFASSAFDADELDLYHATGADSPAWRWVATLRPARAGLQVLSATYRLPPGALQAVRARFRYGGTASPCGTLTTDGTPIAGLYDDHDDLAFAVPFVANASRDASLRVPRCTDKGFYCDSGTLLDGRAGLGPEAHAPNTLRASCADGAAGTYHVEPSIDGVRVYTPDATPLAVGTRAVAEVDVFASSAWADEAVDLHVTDDALAATPVWTHAATLSPAASGLQTLAAEIRLGTGLVQAVRASYRSAAATPQACSTGATDDHDDLAFDVRP